MMAGAAAHGAPRRARLPHDHASTALNPSGTAATLPALPPPALPGQPLRAVDTPAPVLDLDAFARNLERMQSACDRAGVQLRPHAKAHKCPDIALAQVARGAVGICCQKVSEALPSSPPASVTSTSATGRGRVQAGAAGRPGPACPPQRLRRRRAPVEALAEACATAGSRLSVLVEIDIGQGRCGVADGTAALRPGGGHRPPSAAGVPRPAGLPRRHPAPARPRRAARGRARAAAYRRRPAHPAGRGRAQRSGHRRRHRQRRIRPRQRRLHRTAAGLLRLHGCRLRAQTRRRGRRAALRAQPLPRRHGDERGRRQPRRAARDRRRRPQVRGDRLRPAAAWRDGARDGRLDYLAANDEHGIVALPPAPAPTRCLPWASRCCWYRAIAIRPSTCTRPW